MAIASKGSMGTGASSTSNNTLAMTTATTALSAADVAILVISSDNTTTVDGDNSEVTGVADTAGNVWEKLGERTNTVGGVAADGVTTSVWRTHAKAALATGGTITATFNGNRTDKCCSCWAFTTAAGKTVAQTTSAAVVLNGVDASNDFGSAAFSSLPSLSRLYFRGLGKEANSTTDLTVSANFTLITLTRSRNNASAVIVRGEFRINTSTGETSNPTLAVSGDTAGVFLALEEVNFLEVGSESMPAALSDVATLETGQKAGSEGDPAGLTEASVVWPYLNQSDQMAVGLTEAAAVVDLTGNQLVASSDACRNGLSDDPQPITRFVPSRARNIH